MSVTREEYTDPTGERRADVLLTAETGQKVAFEVQYSPITREHWQTRHESYRQRGIVDVWFFGHTTVQVDSYSWLSPRPMQQAALETRTPLLVIDPQDPDDVRSFCEI